MPSPDFFPNGVASGDITQTSSVLWTSTQRLGNVTFEYSTSQNFSSILGKKTIAVTNVLQPVKVEITGLNPGTTYYYRAIDASSNSLSGQFKTANATGEFKGLHFGVSGDWRGELAPYPVVSNVAAKQLDFFVFHGDTIYADDDSPALVNANGTLKAQAETLDDFRIKHNEVYSNRFGQNTLADLRRSTAILATIDDHEVTNDFAGGADVNADPEKRFKDPAGTLQNDSVLYNNGLQAFQEYNPLRDEFYGNTGDNRTAGERKLYRYNTFGSDAATFVLDARSFRDAQLPGGSVTDPASVVTAITRSLTEDRTLLGKAQLADLKQDLLRAQGDGITWKFVMIPEPIQNIAPGLTMDNYDGYMKERTELLKFINESAIDNVVFISADVHTTFVNNLTYQTQFGGPQIATNAFEITTGAVAYDPPTGSFVGNLLTAGNPQLKAFYDSLPIAPDLDNLPNDKDDFVKQGFNSTFLKPLGYDPIGLNDNLPQAEGLIKAKLLQGDYFVGHSYSWSEFDINPVSQKLTVTTWGFDAYTEAALLANPKSITDRQPQILSQFEVEAGNTAKLGTNGNDTLYGTNGNDNINALGGNNIVYAGEGRNIVRSGSGNDMIYTGSGDDLIQAGAGNNSIYAGEGNNQIFTDSGDDWIYTGSGNDTIAAGLGNNLIYAGEGNNTITSRGNDTIYLGSGADRIELDRGTNAAATIIGFNTNDRISLGGTLKFQDLSLQQSGFDTVLSVGSDPLATLKWTNVGRVTSSLFLA
jgi:phosphodiesterase/alkaline phosphatase D-like protein